MAWGVGLDIDLRNRFVVQVYSRDSHKSLLPSAGRQKKHPHVYIPSVFTILPTSNSKACLLPWEYTDRGKSLHEQAFLTLYFAHKSCFEISNIKFQTSPPCVSREDDPVPSLHAPLLTWGCHLCCDTDGSRDPMTNCIFYA